MKKISFVMILLFIVFGCTTGQKLESLEGMPPEAPVKTVHLKGENCSWAPSLVRIDKGAKVILEVESVDADYNFKLEGYNLRFEVPKATTVTASFYASRAGEFEFGCYIEKGLRYSWGGMVGKLIVE
jgi:heme/copper-type cytochrome/quinol oxidase subunit 2